jgi:hypothetical protein
MPAQAEMTFGQLCQRIITKSPIPANQNYVLVSRDKDKVPFNGNMTSCVIWQMAAFGIHEQNWDYAKEQVQGFNQQPRSLRDKVATAIKQGDGKYPDLEALTALKYMELKYPDSIGPQAALGQGPAVK